MYLFLHRLCNCSIFVCGFIYGIMANEQMDHPMISDQQTPPIDNYNPKEVAHTIKNIVLAYYYEIRRKVE